MTFLVLFVFGAYFVLYSFAFVLPSFFLEGQNPLLGPSSSKTPHSDLDSWLDGEEKIAVDRLLANVAPSGRNTRGAAPGTVLASPSRSHPNYHFQWVRDAAITMSTVTDLYNMDPSSYFSTQLLLPTLESYAVLSAQIQHTPNPSGDFSFPELLGLGEPKFQADGSAFTENWGRPQRDGPALRATALMQFVRAYNESHPGVWEARSLQNGDDDWFGYFYDASMPSRSVIKADLEYVARHWGASGFDVWEEVQGRHFFTGMAQLRALREGAELASLFADDGAAAWYKLQAKLLEKSMKADFWDDQQGFLRATRGSNAERERSGLDCSVLLGSLHGNALEPTYPQSPVFPPHDDAVLATLLALVRDQGSRFPINAVPASGNGDDLADPLRGVGIGRYPEDVYDGYGAGPAGSGNPWFLCTASVSEVLYRTVEQLRSQNTLTVSERGWPFWEALVCHGGSASDATSALTQACPLQNGTTYDGGDAVFQRAVARLQSVGDAFLGVVKKHADGQGALSEQFDRWTGFERGALDLTWSYGAFLQALWARRRVAEA